MNLFALTSNPSARIRKFMLTAQIQSEVETLFTGLEAEFSNINLEIVPFDGKYKPENDEVLEIAEFEDIDDLGDAIRNPAGVADFIPDHDGMFYQICALFTGKVDQNGDVKVYIQKFDKRKVLSTSGLSIFFSDNQYKKVDGKGISIDRKLTALLVNSRLRFKSFFLLRQIFDMSSYYNEATDQDIRDFGNDPFVQIPNIDEFVGRADHWTRRKIGLIRQSGVLDKLPLNVIKAIADEYQVPLEIQNEKVVFPSEKKDLKKLLRFLDEDYYKSPLTQQHWMANSKRVVGAT